MRSIRNWSGMRTIMTVTFVCWVLQMLLAGRGPQTALDPLGDLFALRAYTPDAQGGVSFNLLFPLQLFTYMLVHSLSLSHVAFNMLYLWFFGRDLEATMGKAGFLRLYLLGGFVGGLAVWVFNLATHDPTPVLGASGAVYAVLALFALRYPRRTIIVFPIFIPIPVIFIVAFKVASDLMGFLSGAPGIAFLAHLGGAAVGAVWFRRGDVLARAQATVRRHRTEKAAAGESDDRREMDRILRKIQATGLQTLEASEREFLDRRSRELREKRG